MHHLTKCVIETKPKIHEGPLGGPDSQDSDIFIPFPGGSHGKEFACNVGDPGSIPGPGRSPGEWNGNPLQGSCLENSMDRGAW